MGASSQSEERRSRASRRDADRCAHLHTHGSPAAARRDATNATSLSHTPRQTRFIRYAVTQIYRIFKSEKEFLRTPAVRYVGIYLVVEVPAPVPVPVPVRWYYPPMWFKIKSTDVHIHVYGGTRGTVYSNPAINQSISGGHTVQAVARTWLPWPSPHWPAPCRKGTCLPVPADIVLILSVRWSVRPQPPPPARAPMEKRSRRALHRT